MTDTNDPGQVKKQDFAQDTRELLEKLQAQCEALWVAYDETHNKYQFLRQAVGTVATYLRNNVLTTDQAATMLLRMLEPPADKG